MAAVRPPISGIEEAALGDSDAKRESKDFARLDELDEAKHAVKLAIHRVLAWLIPGSIILFFVLYWIGVVIYAIHMVSTGWMTEPQVHELRAVLFSGFVGAVISQGIKKFLD